MIEMIVAGPVVQWPSEDHPAWDIACMRGAPVHATIDGHLETGWSGRMGNTVTITGDKGRAYYAHLRDTIEPRVVAAGEVIGTCGNTGSWSSGPHVHYEFNRPR